MNNYKDQWPDSLTTKMAACNPNRSLKNWAPTHTGRKPSQNFTSDLLGTKYPHIIKRYSNFGLISLEIVGQEQMRVVFFLPLNTKISSLLNLKTASQLDCHRKLDLNFLLEGKGSKA